MTATNTPTTNDNRSMQVAASSGIVRSGTGRNASDRFETFRLKQRFDFLRVAGRKVKWATPGLVLQAAPFPVTGRGAVEPRDQPFMRIGFTTSKKVGRAVERNRARRRLRALADLIMPFEAKPGFDYVIIGRSATVKRPFDLLERDLRSALKRLDKIR